MAKRFAVRADLTDPETGIAQEFECLSTGIIQTWLNIAQKMIGLERFDDQTSEAHALLTAHFLKATDALDIGDGERGPIASEAHGPASVSYAAMAAQAAGAEFSGTIYGRQFEAIRRVIRGIGGAVRVGQG